MTYEQYLIIAEAAARKAGAVVLTYYKQNIFSEMKHNGTPVTAADLASETTLLESLTETALPVISEESDMLVPTNDKLFWLVDPLDGTENFMEHDENFCIMVGLVASNQAVLGLIYEPVHDILTFAFRGGGCFQKVGAAPLQKLSLSTKLAREVTMVVSKNHPSMLEDVLPKALGITKRIALGSAGVKAVRVAANQADLYVKKSTKMGPWDRCAGDIIVREAGGIVTDLEGRVLTYSFSKENNVSGFIMANNAPIHTAALTVLKNQEIYV